MKFFFAPRPYALAVAAVVAASGSGAIIWTRAADAQTPAALDASANATWLDALDLSKMTTGYGKPQSKLSTRRKALTMSGRRYERGVGTHAMSQIAIDLGGRGRIFSASVGVDDGAMRLGSVHFEVYLDGKRVARSGLMRRGVAPETLSVDLAGAGQMILRVDDNDDGNHSDHADWGDALILMQAGALPPVAVAAPLVMTSVDLAPPMPIARASVAQPQPKICGARVTAATPGRPFLFKIPATGQMPLIYVAQGLPVGLSLDAKTGIISGALQQAGTSVVKLSVSGPRGKDARNLTIMGGKHALAQTPPMGWNSWNAFNRNVDEAKMRRTVDEIVATGLDKHGYQYINIDDAWQGERDANGNIQSNKKFGDMKALGDYIHARGLKFGIYSSPGPKTCADFEGSYEHEMQDAQTYATWGVDFLKYDRCSYGKIDPSQAVKDQKFPYVKMRAALDGVNRDIVYSLCQYGMADVWKWGNDADVGGDLWRTTRDIGPSYGQIAEIGFAQSALSDYAQPSGWNDPDMLFVHALKPNEQITHLTLWSMLAAPLLIGSDISKLSPYSLDALSNDEVIEVDQDPLAKQGKRVAQGGDLEVWARPLWDGTLAVALFNRGPGSASVTAKWSDLGIQGTLPVRDLWEQKDLGLKRDALSLPVPPHGARLFKIGAPNADDYVPRK